MKKLLKTQQNRILAYILLVSIIFIGGIIQENMLLMTKNQNIHAALQPKNLIDKATQTLSEKEKQQSEKIKTQLLKKGIVPKEALYWNND